MELTPQALHDVEFREARRGGYNTRDVDDFLERVAVGIGQLQDRLREAYHRAEAAEGRLAEMQRQLDDLQRRGPGPIESPSPVPSPLGAGAPPAVGAPAGGQGDADETLRRTLVLAQRTADATIKEAKDEATRVLDDAREEAARTRAAAETEAMRDAKVEVDRLEEARDGLLHDIEVLEHHVDEQRERVRTGVDELQRLLDDPNALRTSAAPPVSNLARRSVSSPSLDVPAPPARDRERELPSFDPPSFDPPSFDPPSFDEPVPVPAAAAPAPEPGSNGSFVPKGGQVTIPAPEPEPEPVGPSANGHSADDLGPAANNPLNDGAMVAALQELHGTVPSREALPSRGDPQRDGLPTRDPAPVRETFEVPSPRAEPLPARDAGPAGLGAPPVHEPFETLPPREPLPSRGDVGLPSFEPLSPHEPLPSRGDVGSPFESLPPHESLPSRGDVGSPFESLPSHEPLPSRGDAGLGAPPVHEPFETLPPREPAPAHDSFEALIPRDPLPSRGGDAGPGHSPFETLPPREPLPSRDAVPSLDPLPSRDPLPARNADVDPGAGAGLEPLNFPPPTPGATGFLPNLNAAFNPPPPPADDLGVSPTVPAPPPNDDRNPLSLDSPPPPPPPPGFEHLNRDVGGIPIEPGSRPSEWGRGVFDTEDDLDGNGANARFGRRH